MQRVCAAALLHHGKTIIHNPGVSDDDKAALRIIEQLGATVNDKGNHIEILSNGIRPITDTINCGESGLSARLFIALASLHDKAITITGHGSLLKRPMLFFDDILPMLGVHISSNNHHLPLTVKGPLQPANITIDGSLSSQYLSGLLMAYGFTATESIVITADNLSSKPYTDITIDVLQQFGVDTWHEAYKIFKVAGIKKQKTTVDITIETDWSAAANWLVADAICGGVTVSHLNHNSAQADKAILPLLQNKSAFAFDATDCPDLIPILAIFAGTREGTSTIKGVHRLIHKESNRIKSTTAMLQQLGVQHQIIDDSLSVTGRDTFNSCTIDAFNDHRIVMAAAIAALYADGGVTINGAEAVSKSYPDFFSHLSSLGAKCILKDE